MVDVPSFHDDGDGSRAPEQRQSGPGDHQLVSRPASSRSPGPDRPHENVPPEGAPDAFAGTDSRVPHIEVLRGCLASLTQWTVMGIISPHVSAVAGSHINTLINSDSSRRASRESSTTLNGSQQGKGADVRSPTQSKPDLSDENVDELLETVLSCNPALVHILEPFFVARHVERVRAFYGEQPT